MVEELPQINSLDENSPLPSLIVSRYQPIRKLGAGSAGTVFLCRDIEVGGLVAVKLLQQRAIHSPLMRARFARELHILNSIRHPHVVSMLDCFCKGNVVGYVMEYCSGLSLAELIRTTEPWQPNDIRELARQIFLGLQALHDRDVLHRDLKPANILCGSDGSLRIADFGIAKFFESEEPDQSRVLTKPSVVTDHGAVVGTLPYLAPEAIHRGIYSIQSDIYALGVILFEAAVGKLPWDMTSWLTLVEDKTRHVEVPNEVRSRVGVSLSNCIDQCLALSASARPANSRELAKLLTLSADLKSPAGKLPLRQPLAKSAAAPSSSSKAQAWGPTHVESPVASSLLAVQPILSTGPSTSSLKDKSRDNFQSVREYAAALMVMLVVLVIAQEVRRHLVQAPPPKPILVDGDVSATRTTVRSFTPRSSRSPVLSRPSESRS